MPSSPKSAGPRQVDLLVEALYGISSMRRELQRLAGVEHAVAAITALGIVGKTGPLRITEVAASLQVDPSVASRLLHSLHEKELVERIADPEDGRSSRVAISPRGRETLETVHRRLVEGLTEALADWSPEQVTDLAAGLARLQQTLGGRPTDSEPSA